MKIKKIFKIIKQISYMLTPKLKHKSVFVCLLIVIQSFVELFGATSLIPFLYALMEPMSLLENKYLAPIFELFHIQTADAVIIVSSIGVASVFLLRLLFNLLSKYVQLNFENHVMKYMSLTMLTSYLKRPYTDMIEINSAEALRGIGNDATSTYYVLQNLFLLLSNFLKMLVFVILIFVISPLLALGSGIGAGACVLLVFSILKKTVSKSGKIFNETNFLSTKTANESLSGIKEITVLNRKNLFIKRYEDVVEEKRKAEFRYRFLQESPGIIIDGIFRCLIIAVASIYCVTNTDISSFIPQIAVFAYSGLNLMTSISGVSANTTTVIYYMTSFNKAYENINIARDYQKRLQQEKNISESSLSIPDNESVFNDRIKIDNISWKYLNGKKNVLDGVSIEIKKGESIAFTGSSGAGKTTLADVILGLLKPQSGSVTVDDRSIYDISTEWAKTVGYVPQMPFLLDDTVRNNILFGQPVFDGVDEKVWEALEQANIKDYVQSLPLGLDTVVGERGIKFSGGQRQRLTIARALFGNPELLVLDEATSALDSDTEKAVMEAIDTLHGKKTLIIIAHRLSTIEKCNAVYEIKDGKVCRKK